MTESGVMWDPNAVNFSQMTVYSRYLELELELGLELELEIEFGLALGLGL